jgi:hypothetical protein
MTAPWESLDAAFTAGARAFRARQPCRAPAHYSGDLAEAWTDGWHAEADIVRGEFVEPAWDARQIPLPFMEARA